MKKLVNPTTYFFEQAEKTPSSISPEIEEFTKKLLNKDECQLCKKPYDIYDRIPRILIHCGHTFCTPCLEQFYMKSKTRVRCPMCLKLVKQLESMQRLPINHTVFGYLVEKETQKCAQNKKQPIIKDASKYLYAEFERVQKQAHRQEHPLKYDDESGLPFCVFHSDRVQHFYCQSHKTFGCRVCIQIGHSKSDCNVVDLYTVQNPLRYQNIMQARIQQSYPAGCKFQPNAIDNMNGAIDNRNFGFNNILDPALIDDEDDSDEAHRSV